MKNDVFWVVEIRRFGASIFRVEEITRARKSVGRFLTDSRSEALNENLGGGRPDQRSVLTRKRFGN
jgi:hypothetical protein